jgi:hypothetical protein
MSYYPHNTFTFCSSSSKLGFNVKNAFSQLLKEFEKGNVTYPRTDGIGHSYINVINEKHLSLEIKNILKEPPLYKETEEYYIGDVYSLAGVLNLSTPASLISDIEKAKKLKIEKKEKIDPYIGIKRKNFIESETIYIDTEKINSMDLLTQIYENDVKRNKHKIPALKEKELVV